MTLVGGIAVGVFERIVLANVDPRNQSIVDLYLFVAALVLVVFLIRNPRDDAGWSLAAQVKPIPERLRSLWYVRRLPQLGSRAGVRVPGRDPAVPVAAVRRSSSGPRSSSTRSIALSITPLAGWAGQLSLGQFAFVGLGALTMVLLRSGLDIPVPFDLWDMQFQLAWLPAAIVATAVGVLAAVAIGIPALRARGLFLAVITLAFAVMCSNWLFRQPTWTGTKYGTSTPRLEPPVIGSIDFSNRRSMYYLCFGVLVVVAAIRRAAASHRRRPLDDRGARQRGHGRGVDRPDEPGQGDVVRVVGRHRRARGDPAHHLARAGHARRRRSRPTSRCWSSPPP